MARTSLAVIMDRLGISQGELARRTQLSRNTIADVYHGRGPVLLETKLKIVRELNIPLAAIDPVAADELDGLVIR